MTSEEHHAVCHEPDEEATCAEHQHQPDDAGPPTQQEPTEKIVYIDQHDAQAGPKSKLPLPNY